MGCLLHKSQQQPVPVDVITDTFCDELNAYFISKIANIRTEFNYARDAFVYDEKCETKYTEFKQIDGEIVTKLITTLKSSTCKSDPIPTKLLKECTQDLAPLFTKIINKSLSSRAFPSCLKYAIIMPRLKKT